MKSFWLVLAITFILSSEVAHSATVTLPVPEDIMTKVTLSIQKLEEILKYFGTFLENKHSIYKRVELTKKYLKQLSDSLSQYNNVIAGGGNSVNGSKNIVIGNYNNVEGSNNWVFVSAFTGKINGDLLVGDWRIQLDKSNLILVNSRLAVSLLNDTRNSHMKSKYFGSSKRQLCKFDKWTRPDNDKTDSFWKKFNGYTDWKSSTIKSLFNLGGSSTSTQTSTSSWGNWGSFGWKW